MLFRSVSQSRYEQATAPQKTIDQLAHEVIQGKHGNGEDRKKSLGNQYEAVQKRVTEILKNSTSGNAHKTPSEPSKTVTVKPQAQPQTSQTEPAEKATVSKEDGDLSFKDINRGDLPLKIITDKFYSEFMEGLNNAK